MPGDGADDPSSVTHMLAKGAKQEGARIKILFVKIFFINYS